MSKRILSIADELLIVELKIYRLELLKKLKFVSDRALAKKFNVSRRTIGRVEV